MGSKHCNTDERSVWTSWDTLLKNKHHLAPFHISILVNSQTFQPTAVVWKLIFLYIYFIEKEKISMFLFFGQILASQVNERF